MKKVSSSVVNRADAVSEAVETLTDTSILSTHTVASPITIINTVIEEDSSTTIVDTQKSVPASSAASTTQGIYTTKVAERAVKVKNSESADVVLLSIMWICFALTFALVVSACAVFRSRRSLVKQLKVQVMTEP